MFSLNSIIADSEPLKATPQEIKVAKFLYKHDGNKRLPKNRIFDLLSNFWKNAYIENARDLLALLETEEVQSDYCKQPSAFVQQQLTAGGNESYVVTCDGCAFLSREFSPVEAFAVAREHEDMWRSND